jgi:pimeloyl-ACP methyl ester carboxylesterase
MTQLVSLSVRAGTHMESQSGVQMLDPKIFGRLEDGGCSKQVAFVVAHPTSNFMNHYLLEPLRERGCATLALNTRYVGNDSMLLMERAIQDLGAGVRFLREQGYQKVVLIGNSGGGALAAFYQQQAEKLTITTTPDGRSIDLHPDQLPPADAIALLCAHPGRSHTLTQWLDPSVLDEHDLMSADPELDLYHPGRGAPFNRDWLAHYRAAQVARNERLTAWALARLRELEQNPGRRPATDQAFVIHRTMADPRFLDMTLDPSDRVPGTVWGEPQSVNYAANNVGRFTTLRSFLSQWSWSHSRAKGPECLGQTSVPVLNVEFTADQIVFPSQSQDWSDAAAGRCTDHKLRGINHYPQGNAQACAELADTLVAWSR